MGFLGAEEGQLRDNFIRLPFDGKRGPGPPEIRVRVRMVQRKNAAKRRLIGADMPHFGEGRP